jgi:hypothetical protein
MSDCRRMHWWRLSVSGRWWGGHIRVRCLLPAPRRAGSRTRPAVLAPNPPVPARRPGQARAGTPRPGTSLPGGQRAPRVSPSRAPATRTTRCRRVGGPSGSPHAGSDRRTDHLAPFARGPGPESRCPLMGAAGAGRRHPQAEPPQTIKLEPVTHTERRSTPLSVCTGSTAPCARSHSTTRPDSRTRPTLAARPARHLNADLADRTREPPLRTRGRPGHQHHRTRRSPGSSRCRGWRLRSVSRGIARAGTRGGLCRLTLACGPEALDQRIQQTN